MNSNVDNQPSANEPVEFDLAADQIVVDAHINGVGKRMIVDTGAGMTIINRRTVKALGLTDGANAVAGGAGDHVDPNIVELGSLSVGGATLHGVRGVSMDLTDVCRRVGEDVDGIIGADFLSEYRVTIDYSSRRLSLR